MALYTASQGSSASAAPGYGVVCSHSSMVVSGQGPAMHAENLLRAVGLHPLPKWSHCTEARLALGVRLHREAFSWPLVLPWWTCSTLCRATVWRRPRLCLRTWSLRPLGPLRFTGKLQIAEASGDPTVSAERYVTEEPYATGAGTGCTVRGGSDLFWCVLRALRSCLSFLFLFLCSVSVASEFEREEASMGGMQPQTERPPHVSLICCSH